MRKVFFGIMFLIFLMCGNRPIFAVTVPLTPESQAGTCNATANPNATNPKDRACYVSDYTCDIKNGWGPYVSGDGKLVDTGFGGPGGPDLKPNCSCKCDWIKWFKPETCVAKVKSGWYLTANYKVYNYKYYFPWLYNFCPIGTKPEAYVNDFSWLTGSIFCRCIPINAPMSPDGMVSSNQVEDIYDPNSSSYIRDGSGSKTSELGQVDITSVGTGMFCENNGVIDKDNPKVKTAIGCLPVTINGFIGWIIPNLFGIIGGIAFLIMIYGFIMMSASDGDPKKAAAAKETITAAITGLILSIFAIFLVRLIMLYVLRLPGVK